MGKDPGSIPMDDPLALFLTWTTYGLWLPGDERGWVEKPGRFRERTRSAVKMKVLPRRWGTVMMKALDQVRANGVRRT